MPRESAKTSSGSTGSTNADAKRAAELALRRVGAMLAAAHRLRGGGIARRPGDERVQSLDRDRHLTAQQAEDVGRVRAETSAALHATHLQPTRMPPRPARPWPGS